MCVRRGEGIAACICTTVCVYVTLWQQGKLEVISSILLKPLEKGRAAGGKKDKSHRYNGKKKCIITLRASQW